MTPVLEDQLSKILSFPIKTEVSWALGIFRIQTHVSFLFFRYLAIPEEQTRSANGVFRPGLSGWFDRNCSERFDSWQVSSLCHFPGNIFTCRKAESIGIGEIFTTEELI